MKTLIKNFKAASFETRLFYVFGTILFISIAVAILIGTHAAITGKIHNYAL
jgi:uncharacterized membrane protein